MIRFRFSAFWLLTIFLFGMLAPTYVHAFDFQIQETISVSEPVTDDFHAVGGKIVVDERVSGDLTVIGGEATINEDVEGDLVGAVGRLVLNANVADDLRIAAGEVIINGTVGDDLIVRGGRIVIGPDALIQGDLIIARGGRVEMNGSVQGEARIRGGRVTLNGVVGGDLISRGFLLELLGEVRGNSNVAARTLLVGEGAEFSGNVEYWQRSGENPELFNSAFHQGEIRYNPELAFGFREISALDPAAASHPFWDRLMIGGLLSSVLMLLLLALFAQGFFQEAVRHLNKRWGKYLMGGFLYFLLTPFVALILIMSFIGLPFGIFTFFIYGFSLYLAKVLAAFLWAQWIDHRFDFSWNKLPLFGVSLGLFIVLRLLLWIPFAGIALNAVVICIAFGALLMTSWKKLRKMR